MESESSGVARPTSLEFISQVGWGASFTLGLITLVLGVVLAFRPTQSLTVIAVLIGVVMVVSGIYHIVRALFGREHERLWRGISGVLFLLAGLVLLRHLHLSIALIGLFVGFTWIIQGVTALIEVFSPGYGLASTGWSVFFGIISLVAGIVVVSAPITSVGALTIFMGIWFIVMGAFEMVGSLIARHELRKLASGGGVPIPEQRSSEAASGQGVTGDSRPTSQNIPRLPCRPFSCSAANQPKCPCT
jgi:uncharacterized membrane protein HdeD (DUF308 family)